MQQTNAVPLRLQVLNVNVMSPPHCLVHIPAAANAAGPFPGSGNVRVQIVEMVKIPDGADPILLGPATTQGNEISDIAEGIVWALEYEAYESRSQVVDVAVTRI